MKEKRSVSIIGSPTIVLLLLTILTGCQRTTLEPSSAEKTTLRPNLPRFDWSSEQLKERCDTAAATLKSRVEQIIIQSESGEELQQNSNHSPEATIAALDQALANFHHTILPLGLLKDVSTDAGLRASSQECHAASEKIEVELFSNPQLGAVLSRVHSQLSDADKLIMRLATKFLQQAEQNGATLPEKQRQEFVKGLKRLSEIKVQFSTNIREDKSELILSAEHLDGLSDEFKQTLKTTPAGKYRVPAHWRWAKEVMTWAKDAETRRAMVVLRVNQAAKENSPLFKEAILLRHKLATLLSTKRRPKGVSKSETVTHADFVTERRLAGSKRRVLNFLNDISSKLAPLVDKEYATLLAYKQREIRHNAKALTKEERQSFRRDGTLTLQMWDVRYYVRQWQEKELQLDSSEIRKYFPMQSVVQGTLDIYENLLGVRFKEIDLKDFPDATWHQDVKLYEVREAGKNGELAAYFYTDLFPRENKYSHFAAAALVLGGLDTKDKHRIPIGVMLGNFKEYNDLRNVQTFFHEFGHIMHNALARTRFFSQSGYMVPWDFIEAPSQMMENWLTTAEGLQQVAVKPIPKKLVTGILQSRKFEQGAWSWITQVFLGLADMTYHGQVPGEDFNAEKIWQELSKRVTRLPPLPNNNRFASFNHLINGYDAAYYSYLWSLRYAQDMFTRFKQEGIFDYKTGMAYRRAILEPGDSMDVDDAVENFLGRPVNNRALLAHLGLAKD